MSHFKRFLNNQAGATAVIFGLALVPVAGSAGIALDYSRANAAKAALQNAVDATALAIASDKARGVRGDTARYMKANLATRITILDLKMNGEWINGGQSYQLKASGNVKTTIAGLFKPSIAISSTAVATTGSGSLATNEFVFAFDTTASMSINGCFSCAVTTLKQTLQKLKDNSATGSFSAAFLPFSDRINIGTSRASWLSVPAPADWKGCVEPREQNIAGRSHVLTDTSPAALRFKPTAAGHFISNLGTIYGRADPWCPAREMVAPSNDIGALERAMNGMSTGGTGRFDEAMAWAWRTVSPEWRGQFGSSTLPAAYAKGTKTVVILTDGYTEAYRYEVGGTAGGVFGYNRGSRAGFENFVSVCESMKNKDISIHVIFTRTGNSDFKSYARKCATSSDQFHIVGDTPALESVFRSIGNSKTTTARLSR